MVLTIELTMDDPAGGSAVGGLTGERYVSACVLWTALEGSGVGRGGAPAGGVLLTRHGEGRLSVLGVSGAATGGEAATGASAPR